MQKLAGLKTVGLVRLSATYEGSFFWKEESNEAEYYNMLYKLTGVFNKN